MSTRKRPKNADVPKVLKVDRTQFEGIVKRLIHTDHTKRDDVKVGKKKPHRVIPPQP